MIIFGGAEGIGYDASSLEIDKIDGNLLDRINNRQIFDLFKNKYDSTKAKTLLDFDDLKSKLIDFNSVNGVSTDIKIIEMLLEKKFK